MGVNNNYEMVVCKGDSNRKTFDFPFRCLRIADLVVEYVDVNGSKTELTAGKDYIVQTDFDNSGGIVYYPVVTGVSTLSSDESLKIYRKTPMNQEESEFECEYRVEAAIDKNLMLIQEVDEKSNIASKMIEGVTDSSALTMKKVLELSNKIENLQFGNSSMAIKPQTIVKGATGDIPSSWEDGWCDKPAQHLGCYNTTGSYSSLGDSDLIIQAGLQVAAGVEGLTVLSNELETDIALDLSSAFAQPSGIYYVYADIDSDSNLSFGYTDVEPEVGLQNLATSTGDFYNISTHTHTDKDGSILKRVYIGEFEFVSIFWYKVVNYQHGTICTLPVNDGEDITSDSKYYVDRPFMGNCVSQVRIYHENKWGGAGWMHWYSNASGARGTTSNFTDGLLSIQTGYTSLTTNSCYGGGEFTTITDSAPAKVTVTREW